MSRVRINQELNSLAVGRGELCMKIRKWVVEGKRFSEVE